MCFPDDGKIRVCLDADYAGRDTDEVLKVCDFQDEATEFADEWATKQAEKMVDKSDPDFEAMKRIYKKQLCYYNFDKAPKSKCIVSTSSAFWQWNLKKEETTEKRNKDLATALTSLAITITEAKVPVKLVGLTDKLGEIVQIVGYKTVEKDVRASTEKINSIEFFFRDTIVNEKIEEEK